MKKLIACIFLIPTLANAQSLIGGKNIIKTNLSSLALGNYSLTYERSVFKKLSLSVTYRKMDKKTIPYQDKLKSYLNDPEINFGLFEIGNTAITPEARIYLGLGKMKGFYIAPYARFANFDFTVPVKFQSTVLGITVTKDAPFVGNIQSTSGGLMIGMQYQLLKKLVIDIWLLGGHYGNSNGTLTATFDTPLNSFEIANLQSKIDGLNLTPFKTKGKVDASGKFATLSSEGPWAGIRALGINLGIRF